MEIWQKLASRPPSVLKKIQNQKLVYLANHLVPYHPFYRELFRKNNLAFNQITSVDDLVKFPFSSKVDLLPSEERPAKAKDFIFQPDEKLLKQYAPKSYILNLGLKKMLGQDTVRAVEREFKPIHLHFTTGRSTAQIPFFYSYRDLEQLGQTGVRFFETIGASKNDVLINAFPFAPHLAFWFAAQATPAIDLLALHTGGGKMMGTQKIIDAIEKLNGSILTIMPGYGYHLLREAVAQKKNFSSLKFVILGGERVNPGLRSKLKDMLAELGAKDVKVLSTYAFTESKTAWIQCNEDSGYHLYPDLEYIELIGKDGKQVPEGTSGEIVYTTLDWRASAVIRYKTGDWSKGLYSSKPCEYCGRTVPRLHFDIERQSENVELSLTKVKGELINLNSFYTVVHALPGVDEWQVEIKKKNNDPLDIDEVIVHLALKNGANEAETIATLKTLIANEVGVSADIQVHTLKELIQMLGLESEVKEKRILDRRKEK